MVKPVKTGLASFGVSGSVFHGPLLHVNSGFEIISILERTKNISRDHYPSTRLVRTFDELINDKEIELIIINTPDNTHHELCKKALSAGKNVVSEKPFTQTIQQAEELVEIAERKNLVLSIFHNRRWDGDFRTVKQIIKEERLGRLVNYEAHFDRYRNFIQKNTWKEDPGTGVGTLYNLGSHLIDQALHLFGLPYAVYADIRTLRTGGKIDDSFDLLLKYDGIKVNLRGSYLVREPLPRYTLHGTLGSFLKWGIDPQEQKLREGNLPSGDDWGKDDPELYGLINTENGHKTIREKVPTIPGNYHLFYDGIHKAIRHNDEPPVKATDGLNVARVINAAFLSNDKGQDIRI